MQLYDGSDDLIASHPFEHHTIHQYSRVQARTEDRSTRLPTLGCAQWMFQQEIHEHRFISKEVTKNRHTSTILKKCYDVIRKTKAAVTGRRILCICLQMLAKNGDHSYTLSIFKKGRGVVAKKRRPSSPEGVDVFSKFGKHPLHMLKTTIFKPVLAWEREARFKLQHLAKMAPCIFHPHSMHVPFEVPYTFPAVPHIFLAHFMQNSCLCHT